LKFGIWGLNLKVGYTSTLQKDIIFTHALAALLLAARDSLQQTALDV